ncbi:hypothetical protein Q4Q35_11840 [Flavivirga aquimarina]|uniref:Uncharacterized protein n=1 Tax=Flavivirga aquimarina TaxID=2027862 RepID=A0ABT8WBH2_9FLAO|nr:hypothetical protein [Flavivirga aquimarina]MDO5970498.1 hypothetical protein [Flavivirga aquimarina]
MAERANGFETQIQLIDTNIGYFGEITSKEIKLAGRDDAALIEIKEKHEQALQKLQDASDWKNYGILEKNQKLEFERARVGSTVILLCLMPNGGNWNLLAHNLLAVIKQFMEHTNGIPTLLEILSGIDGKFDLAKNVGIATEEYCLMLGQGVTQTGEILVTLTGGHNIAKKNSRSKWGSHITKGGGKSTTDQVHAEIIALYAQHIVLGKAKLIQTLDAYSVEQKITKHEACESCTRVFDEAKRFWSDQNGINLTIYPAS